MSKGKVSSRAPCRGRRLFTLVAPPRLCYLTCDRDAIVAVDPALETRSTNSNDSSPSGTFAHPPREARTRCISSGPHSVAKRLPPTCTHIPSGLTSNLPVTPPPASWGRRKIPGFHCRDVRKAGWYWASRAFFESAPRRGRTCNLRFRRPMLYPLS